MLSKTSDRIEMLHHENTELQVALTKAEQQAISIEARANQLQTDLDAAHAANHHHWQLAAAREQQIQDIYRSYSWRITGPLRWTAYALNGLIPGATKAHATTLVLHAAKYVIARPRLRNAALAFLDRLPSVKSRLSFISIGDAVPQGAAAHVPKDLAHLTPHARRIYADLKAAIEHRQKENR